MTIPQCTFASPSPQEEWRAVVGYEGLYEVSSHGRVRRVASGQGARAGRVLALSLTTRGYVKVQLFLDGTGLSCRVHRLVAAAFIGPCPDGLVVHHRDADRTNNFATNLEYVTSLGNSREMVAQGRSTRSGETTHTHLTAEDVRAIRLVRQQGVPLATIGMTYGISPQAVCDIVKGRTWKHVS